MLRYGPSQSTRPRLRNVFGLFRNTERLPWPALWFHWVFFLVGHHVPPARAGFLFPAALWAYYI